MPAAPPRLLLADRPGVLLPGAAAPLPLGLKDAALLAWLALEGGTPRSRLAALLWPGSDAQAARNSLRQRVFQLRRQAGIDLVAGQEVLQLAAGIAHDLAESDELLGGAPSPVEGEFGRWLETQRARRRGRLRDALAELADAAEKALDWPDALAHAQELLALDPLSEAAHRRLMRLHYLAGDRAAALLAFDRCERTLKDEVGAAPDAETLALLAAIEQSALPRPRLAPPVLRPPRMVGRAHELEALRCAVASGQHVLVVGEGGLGKSRLLAEFAALHGAPIQAGARPGDADLPYALFARLVRTQIGAGRPPAAELVPELARFVPELGPAAATHFEPGRFEHTAERWLLGLPRVPLLVDDLHFADAASLELLLRLAAVPELPPLVLGLRPAGDKSELTQLQEGLGELQRVQRIVLRPLDAAALAELVDSLALPELDGAALAGPLLRHTGGNPQFVLETLRTLLVEGRPPALKNGALPVPAGVGALIERRLKQLSPAALRLARTAAVAGGDFSPALAAQVLGCSLLDLADPWAELEAAQVLAGPAFAHDLVFEAVRAGVPQAIAKPLHAGVAQALEAAAGTPGAIAQHWLAAGETERAVAPLEQAARQADKASRLREAAELWGQLAALHERRGNRGARFRALERRFDHLYELDNGDLIEQALAELESLADGDAERAAALVQRARTSVLTADLERADAAARDAIELARRGGERAIECDARCTLAQALLRRRRTDEAVATLAAIQDWAEGPAAPLAQRVFYQQGMALVVLEQERFREALERWQRVADLGAGQGVSRLTTALNYQALALGYSGRFAKSAEVGERQRALSAEYRLLGNAAVHIDLNLAFAYLHAGRHAQALAALDRAGAEPAAPRLTLELRRAEVYLALGQPGRARAFAQRALELAPDEPQRRLPALTLLRTLAAIMPGPDAEQQALLAAADAVLGPASKLRLRTINRLVEAEVTRGERRLAAADAALALLAGSEMHGLLIGAWTRRAQALLELDRAAEAMPAAEAVLVLGEAYAPELLSVAEAGLAAARVLAACGDARAPRVLDAAADWLHKTAADHVPPEFRDSFMRRVPAHRELLVQAAVPRLEGAAARRIGA